MLNPLVIRDAATADAPAIAALIASLAHHFLADQDDPGSAATFFKTVSEDAIVCYLSDPRYEYAVAEADGILLGVVGMRDATHLYHLFVTEPFQRRGIAAALWTYVRGRAQSKSSVRYFTVNSSRSAVGFYEHLGFTATGPPAVKDGIAFLAMRLTVN